jgi:phage/plasmid-associated DNA primase
MFNFEKIENSTIEELKNAIVGDVPLGEFLYEKIKDVITIIKIIDTDKHFKAYYFDTKEALYKNLDYTNLRGFITDYFNSRAKEALTLLYKDDENKMKIVKKFISIMSKSDEIKKALKTTFNKYNSDPDFEYKLNSSENILPIKNNKVINLETGIIRKRTNKDYFDYFINCEYVKDTKFIKNVVMQIATESQEKYNYIQRVFGYCLTTGNRQQKLFYFHGNGSNSKSTLTELLGEILGDKYSSISKNLIEEQKIKVSEEQKSKDRGSLFNKKVCVCPELGENIRLNMTDIKALTGEDTVLMKKLYSDPKKMKNNCKIITIGNHKVYFDINDYSELRRFNYIFYKSLFISKEKAKEDKIEFKKGVYIKDDNLLNNLKTNYKNEFFSWLVIGAINYYKLVNKKLDPFEYGEEMKEEANKYFDTIDNIGCYLKNFTRKDNNNKNLLSFNDLYSHFQASEYYNNITDKNFNKQLKKRGYKEVRRNDGKKWLNIQLINEEEEEEMKEDLDIIEDCENIKEKERKITINKLKEENEKIKNELKDTIELIEEYKKELEQLKQQLKKDEVKLIIKEKPNNIKIIDDKQEKPTNIIKNLDNLTIEECKNILLKNRKENRKNEKVIPKTIYKDKNEEDIELELDFKKIEIKK